MSLALSRPHLQDLHQKLGLIGQKAKGQQKAPLNRLAIQIFEHQNSKAKILRNICT